MSYDNYIGVMNEGVWNESGDVYLRFESRGFIGDLNNIPVPPPGGGGVVPGGMDLGMSPLNYWRRTRLRSMEVKPWRDSTMGGYSREDEFADELDGQHGDGEIKKNKRDK